MRTDDKIFVAGHKGLVGSAIVRALKKKGYKNIVTCTRSKVDLTDQKAVEFFFKCEQPKYVFLAAAKVGGIHANNTYPADFIYQNLMIQTNVIHAAYRNNCEKLLFLGSSCIYPKNCPQPMREDYLLSGELELTNRPYAIAKISGIEQCWSYNRQYKTKYISLMPTNLYGPGDNYDLNNSHVLPALIRKFHEAKEAGESRVVLWGTGVPRREFLHVDDLAEASIFVVNLDEDKLSLFFNEKTPPLINVGCGKDIEIRQLADLVKKIVGFQGSIVWDVNRPNGTMQKLLDTSVLSDLGWEPSIALESGVISTYQAFLNEYSLA